MNPRWFIRMAKWARHPPSPRMVRMVLGILAIGILLFLIEYQYGWPDWLTVNNGQGQRLSR